ncbi:hypothetical protein BH23GEM9_BH23GEM9_06870 [soil metagenome]
MTGGRARLSVPCHDSERWLKFAEREQYEALDEDLIQIDVMTLDEDGEPYKLCELVVSRGDLLRAIAAYGDPPFRTKPVRKDAARSEARPPRPRRPPSRGEQTEL